jgi:hypothetical protein
VLQEGSENPELLTSNSPEKVTSAKNSKEPRYICGLQLKEFKEQCKGNIVTSFPIKRGNIENLDELEALWYV